MIDLVWNFPLLPQQQELWSRYLLQATTEYAAQPVEAQRPSFRTVERALRERAAQYIGFPVERTWVTSGGHHGNLNALLASGLAGTRFAMEGVTYPGFLDQCRMTRTAIDGCAIDDEGVIPGSLRAICEQALAEGNPVRGFFTMPSVQNPVGFVTPQARREEVVEIAREFDLTIIEDDTYGYMEKGAPPNYAILAPERTFYIRSLAKSLAPAARTGFLVAPESAAGGLTMSLKCTATGTDVPQNLAALAMCLDGAHDRLMEEKLVEGARRNREARAILAPLEAKGIRIAPGAERAWHLWVSLPQGVDLAVVEERINAAGTIVTMGHWCAASAEFGSGMRLALGGEVSLERTLEGIRMVAGVLSTL